MTEPSLDPEEYGPQLQGSLRSESADDIELPAPPEELPVGGSSTGSRRTERPLGRVARFLSSSILIGAIAAIGLSFWWQSRATETAHSNWRYVAAAAEASPLGTTLVQAKQGGQLQTISNVDLTRADARPAVTTAIRNALQQDDLVAATDALQKAQKIASGAPLPQVDQSTRWAPALAEGKTEFFQIVLFDSCDEDGDVVEVSVNGVPFATVPILHQGVQLTIPLAPGQNSMGIRGIRDGGGGVTLGFRTSQGDFFARDMQVGELYEFGINAR